MHPNEQFSLTYPLVDSLSTQISSLLPSGFAEFVEAEIQEEGETVLFRIRQSDEQTRSFTETKCHEALLGVGSLLSDQLPYRRNGYRWVVSLMKNEQVVDAVCGGWEKMLMTP